MPARAAFDILMLAPVDAAARTAVTCQDLCAAAAYRLTGAAALPHGQESDVQRLLKDVTQTSVTLASAQAEWLRALVGSEDWQMLKKARTAVTHRDIESLSILSTSAPVTSLVLDGIPYDNVDLSRRFAQFAEVQFDSYADAVLSGFP
jgi:hypothetical protein